MKREPGIELRPTVSPDDIASTGWDCIVIGAGLAGTTVARQLGQAGMSILLVDKAAFPRRKVCGCYLNGSALQTLKRCGLESLPDDLNAPAVHQVRLGTQQRTVSLALPKGAALSRDALDTELIQQAKLCGVHFSSRTEARVLDRGSREFRSVELRIEGNLVAAKARVVVVADGVGSNSLRDCSDVSFRTEHSSLIGTAAISEQLPDGYESGTIHMAVGKHGYVGALQMQDGTLDVACALASEALKKLGPGTLAKEIAAQSGLPEIPDIEDLQWMGTPPLSRSPSTRAIHRLFIVGDAAGYVEPFTGEGMSWALAGGFALAPIVERGIQGYDMKMATEWNRLHRRLFGRRQKLCKVVTRGLRRPWLARTTIRLMRIFPAIARPLIHHLNKVPT